MKLFKTWILVALTAAALAVGCSAKHKADTSKLSKGFASASAELKAQADTAVKAIKEEKFTEAVAALETLIDKGSLSAEQKQAVQDVAVDVQNLVQQKQLPDGDALQQRLMEIMSK